MDLMPAGCLNLQYKGMPYTTLNLLKKTSVTSPLLQTEGETESHLKTEKYNSALLAMNSSNTRSER